MAGIKKTHQQFRAAMRGHAEDEGSQHWADYRAARDAAHSARKALAAVWWFVENVGEDDKARTDIFFELREIVRGVL